MFAVESRFCQVGRQIFTGGFNIFVTRYHKSIEMSENSKENNPQPKPGTSKVVFATFLLFCFVCPKESTLGTRKNAFYFTSKALFILEISNFNFSDIQMS